MRVVVPGTLPLLWSCVTCLFVVGFIAAPPAQAEPAQAPRILVMGDSLSAAYRIPVEAGWVNLLRERLEQQYPDVTVVNASVSGSTTAAALQILPDRLAEHRPTLVILELGGNDGLQGKPIPHITANLKRMIELSLEAGAEVILTGIRLPPNYGSAYTLPFFQQYAQLAEDYDLERIPFLLEGVAGKADLMQEDRIHPNAEAQAIILETVWPVVQRALKASGENSGEKASAGEAGS